MKLSRWIAVGGLTLAYASPSLAQVARPWALRDSLTARHFAGAFMPLDMSDDAEIQFSPDQSKFFLLTRRGNLDRDSNIIVIHIYRTEEVRRVISTGGNTSALHPVTAVWEGFASDGASIQNLAWDEDSENVTFLAARNDGERLAAFALNARSGRIRGVAKDVNGVEWVQQRGSSSLLGSAAPSPAPSATYPVSVAQRVTTFGEDDLGSPLRTDRLRGLFAVRATHVSYRGGPARTLPVTLLGGPVMGSDPTIAPDGRFAVGIERDGRGFTLVDLEHAATQSIAHLQAGGLSYGSAPEPHAFWLAGSRKVVLINVIEQRGGAQYVGVYDITSGKWSIITCLDPMRGGCDGAGRVEAVSPAGANKVAVRRRDGDRSSETIYDLTPDTPVIVPPADVREQLTVDVLQSASELPRVVASLGGARIELLGADPALAGVRWARQLPFQWEENGQKVTGGLYLPRGYRAGSRIPLVVQASRYRPDQFQPDGAFSGDAAQLLAARGFAVLQYEIPSGGHDEGPAVTRRFEAAVSALSKAGIIDPARIGITGFSRGGFQTFYLITHPGKFVPAAAITIDSGSGDFSAYLENGAERPGRNEAEASRGGSFWAKKEDWLAADTLFNADRVQTPLFAMMSGHRNETILSPQVAKPVFSGDMLSRLGAFRLNRRPLEYWYFPNGDHNLVRPRERQALLSGTVDWMAFWLMGFEDPDPAKADQYARWRRLRDAWRRQQAWEAAGHPPGSLPL